MEWFFDFALIFLEERLNRDKYNLNSKYLKIF